MFKKDSALELSKSSAIAYVVAFVLAGFVGGYALALYLDVHSGVGPGGVPQGVDFAPVWKAWNLIDDNFVPAAVATSSPLATTTAQQNKNKVYGMISGLADSLNDPYTFFLPPAQDAQFNSNMSGAFEGVGMEIEIKNGVLTVVSPLKDTPAANAGIKSGDQVLSINGVSTKDMDTSTAVDEIRGPAGTQVTLSILRAGWNAPKQFKVTRAVINVPVVTSTARTDGVFDIQLSEFTANAPDLFRDALRQFVESGDTKLILDMRGNPGGYLDAAVDIGSWFLPSGDTIVTEDYAGHQSNVVHRSLGYNVFNSNLKMVILVDGGTASASEILSDALRHYGVAQLVGTDTFGKGVVQELFPITPDTSLKVTVARWLGPDGKQIPITGIIPDVHVDLSEADATAGRDPQLNRAVGILLGTATSSAAQ